MNIERGMNSLLPYIEKIKKNRLRIGGLFLMIATPFTAVFLMQYVYCGDPWQISAPAFLANAICVGVLYYLICALLRKPPPGSFLSIPPAHCWARSIISSPSSGGTPVLPWDLTALNTAIAVSSTYDFTPNGPMIITAVSLSGISAYRSVLSQA